MKLTIHNPPMIGSITEEWLFLIRIFIIHNQKLSFENLFPNLFLIIQKSRLHEISAQN